MNTLVMKKDWLYQKFTAGTTVTMEYSFFPNHNSMNWPDPFTLIHIGFPFNNPPTQFGLLYNIRFHLPLRLSQSSFLTAKIKATQVLFSQFLWIGSESLSLEIHNIHKMQFLIQGS